VPDVVAIVDFGLGNLYSVERACAEAGLRAVRTASPDAVANAAAVILPGVGAFGDAMEALRSRGLDAAVRAAAASGTPLVGICLGLQLLFSESREFGRHRGLGIIEGDVRRLEPAGLKVPHIGWNTLRSAGDRWPGTLLDGVSENDYFYFVHSYYAAPADPAVSIATTCYGDTEFCAALAAGNVFACQFHPERSGPSGLRIYRNLAALVSRRGGREDVAADSPVRTA
jgi:glutamine amidotransferase